ncbi:MAG: GNAT family N-acetyltransferase [Actinomycetales bacterium]|nr:GNAT family N-acetyltransferase [Actinomycetales bacterium]
MAITVRPARAEDAEQLFALVQQLGHAIEPRREAFEQTLSAYLAGEEPSVTLLVASGEDGALLGYALTTVVRLLSTNGPSAQLQEIVVSEQARGMAVGSTLVAAVEQLCRDRGVTQLTVASRRAGGFYDRLGFHENAEYMRKLF